MNEPTHKAAQLAKRLSQVDVEKGMSIINATTAEALYFDVIDDAMCIMHSDGSVNIVDNAGGGILTVEVISSRNILRVLKHYRPFRDLFKGQVQ